MAGMIVLSVTLRFLQEARAGPPLRREAQGDDHVTATVVRDGKPQRSPLADLVPGDIINLSAGDMIPGDVRICRERSFVSQGTLNRRVLPVEKVPRSWTPNPANSPSSSRTMFHGHQR